MQRLLGLRKFDWPELFALALDDESNSSDVWTTRWPAEPTVRMHNSTNKMDAAID
jgi:hypothetical protein